MSVLYTRTVTMKYIQKISIYIVALLLPITLVPQFVQAQSADRATLIELISLLQQQIVLLQAQLEDQQAGLISDDGLLDDFPGTVVVNYAVRSELELPPRAPFQHQKYADQLRMVFPSKYRDYIDQFVVFSDHPDDIAAFVAVTSDGRDTTWMYGVDVEEISADPTKAASIELMVHEFAHVFTLDQFITSSKQTNNCHEYFDEIGCYTTGTYLSEFVQEFWNDALLDEVIQATKSRNANRALFQIYERYESDFVTDYAATSPEEDFAETFAWYVLDEEVERGSVAAQKIRFMDSFAQIRDYKEEILSNI
jgi:hypothetical protein